MNRIVGALDLLLAVVLALLLLAAVDCAPDAYGARATEPEDWFGILLWSALILPACASAGLAGLVLLRGTAPDHVTRSAAYGMSVGLAVLSVVVWGMSIATESELTMALVVPVALFVASAWRLRRIPLAAPR